MRVYATAAEYEATTGETAPANVELLLRTASRVVDELLTGRVYDVDTAGMPTDADHVQSLKDATIVVAQEAHETGAVAAGSSQQWDSVGIGSVSLSGRRNASGTLTVFGVPVPAMAHVLLSDVGRLVVYSR